MNGRPSIYHLPHRIATGNAQMAADRALLDWAASGPSRAVYRTYEWARPTLSLGRAEPFPDGWDERALGAAGVEVVRRPTGGDAVLHDGELTFAFAASLPGPWRLRPRAFADLVADALADALQSFHLPAARIGPAEPLSPSGRPGDQPCFARPAAGEVRIGAYKVAGIASHFTRGAALSHASVPLSARHRDVAAFRANASEARADLVRHARAATEILGGDIPPGLLGGRLAEALSARIGDTLREATFSELGIPEPGAS